jgi:hypothetical protein
MEWAEPHGAGRWCFGNLEADFLGWAKVGEHRCFGNAWNSGSQPFCGIGLAMHKSRRLLY